MSSIVKIQNRFFDKYPGNVSKNLRKVMSDTAASMEAYAVKAAPIETGYLQGSIRGYIDENPGTIGAFCETNVEYAIYQEFGTGIYSEGGGGRQSPWAYEDDEGEIHFTWGNHPHPFMRPAMHNAIKQAKKWIKEALKDG